MASNNSSENSFNHQTEVHSFLQSSLKTESVVWFSSAQASTYLDITVQSLMNMTSNGKLPYYKLGRRNRYKKSDLDLLLESSKKGPKYGN